MPYVAVSLCMANVVAVSVIVQVFIAKASEGIEPLGAEVSSKSPLVKLDFNRFFIL